MQNEYQNIIDRTRKETDYMRERMKSSRDSSFMDMNNYSVLLVHNKVILEQQQNGNV